MEKWGKIQSKHNIKHDEINFKVGKGEINGLCMHRRAHSCRGERSILASSLVAHHPPHFQRQSRVFFLTKQGPEGQAQTGLTSRLQGSCLGFKRMSLYPTVYIYASNPNPNHSFLHGKCFHDYITSQVSLNKT